MQSEEKVAKISLTRRKGSQNRGFDDRNRKHVKEKQLTVLHAVTMSTERSLRAALWWSLVRWWRKSEWNGFKGEERRETGHSVYRKILSFALK